LRNPKIISGVLLVLKAGKSFPFKGGLSHELKIKQGQRGVPEIRDMLLANLWLMFLVFTVFS
jgi:hypothetical protein